MGKVEQSFGQVGGALEFFVGCGVREKEDEGAVAGGFDAREVAVDERVAGQEREGAGREVDHHAGDGVACGGDGHAGYGAEPCDGDGDGVNAPDGMAAPVGAFGEREMQPDRSALRHRHVDLARGDRGGFAG